MTSSKTAATTLDIPELCLVLLVGASGTGKTTFAAAHFADTEVVSSDRCRALVSDDENDQSASAEAFALLHHIVDIRLKLGRLTVVDATNAKKEDRRQLVELARNHDLHTAAIVFDIPLNQALANNAARLDRTTPTSAVKRQHDRIRRDAGRLRKERFRFVHRLSRVDDLDTVTVTRSRLWTNKRDDHGPFDIIGDIHGCHRETVELLDALGWDTASEPVRHPEGRRAIFVGDLVDRGPTSPEVLELVMGMVESGAALCVAGNHENKLVKALGGQKVKPSHGLAETLEQLSARGDEAFTERARTFMDQLVSHYVLDDGNLVVCHAGLPERYHGRSSGRVRSFALYGDTTGETDDFGLPVRYPWADDYRGEAAVVYGHTPIPEARWLHNTICLDTGCVFGGKLTALRWPERELVSVDAHEEYYAPTRPLAAQVSLLGEHPPLIVDVEDVLGKHSITTGLMNRINIDADQSAAALEVMSRFAIDPRWLTYLPPTMAPVNTSARSDHLEHPDEAFSYFANAGITEVVCQEKHMGSRAVVTVTRTPEAALDRFGITNGHGGVIHTRTGRSFFTEPQASTWEAALVQRLRSVLSELNWWDEFDTDWFVFDAELLPWSAKASGLIDRQYAPVGQTGLALTEQAVALVAAAQARGVEVDGLDQRTPTRHAHIEAYAEAWARYCWPVNGPSDLALAPFQVLAAEGEVLATRGHRWHLQMIDQLVNSAQADSADSAGPSLQRTDRRWVTLADADAVAEATRWWTEMTAGGGEGMVVKPAATVASNKRGLVLPGVKVRGREYLRMVYGPEYIEPANLERLRDRNLGRKASLARREFALGIESLQRFVDRAHLSQIHQCVFGVLALESDPVDPRL